MRVAIVGGGACGLMAAYGLSRTHPHPQVTVYEKHSAVGRKILMSGNSRGNLSNTHVAPQAYNHPAFVTPALTRYPHAAIVAVAEALGVKTYADEEGRLYPYSDTANSFLDALRLSLAEQGVREVVNYEVFSVELAHNGGFLINGTEPYDAVVIATGSSAGHYLKVPVSTLPKLGEKMRHDLTPLFPTLCPIGVKENLKSLSGLRVSAKATLFMADFAPVSAQGEIQFKDRALSGIAIFELSSFLARAKAIGRAESAFVELDLFPSSEEADVLAMLQKRHALFPERQGVHFLTGLFTKMIALQLTQYLRFSTLDETSLKALAHGVKHWRMNVDMQFVPNNNQVVCGGVDTTEIDPETFASKIVPHLYFGGEVLDIDGLCGGYNLHFAFASGLTIADAILAEYKV